MARPKKKIDLTQDDLTDENGLSRNTFTQGDKFRVRVRRVGINSETGKTVFAHLENNIILPYKPTYETDKKVSVYISADSRSKLLKCNPTTNCLFLWIIYNMESLKDAIWINVEAFMKEASVKSIKTYDAAIVELIKSGFIAYHHVEGWYWINPSRFFCGKRQTKYPDKVTIINPE